MSERSVRYRIECSVGNEGWDCPRLCWPPASILNDNDFTGHFWDLEKALAVLRELREKCPIYGLSTDNPSQRLALDLPVQYRLTKCVETREVLDEQKLKLEQRRVELAKTPYKCELCGMSDCGGHYGEGFQ